jgi:hypothetical protein
MTSRFNPKPNVVYKRSWRGKFCPNNTQKWNSASSTQNWGGEFSIGTLGKFHPALTPSGSDPTATVEGVGPLYLF